MSDIDQKLAELRGAVQSALDTEELYQIIRHDVMSEIQYQELAVFRILTFLLDIWQQDRKLFNIAFIFLANPLKSIREISAQVHESPSSVHKKLAVLSAGNPEIALLLELRKREKK